MFIENARRMKPTQKHRPAVWECMLGTVYAMNSEGIVKYFDYDWQGAFDYAGIKPENDVRSWKYDRRWSWESQCNNAGKFGDYGEPRKGQTVWYVREASNEIAQ